MWNHLKNLTSSLVNGSSFSSAGAQNAQKAKLFLVAASELKDGQMKEIPLEFEGKSFKVLLSKVRGQFYATSHLCPHYKARLATGVLSSDGRVSCPWHAACFDVKTGDIEEAPSVKALKSFPLVIENDNVYVLIAMKDLETSDRLVCDGMQIRADPSMGTIIIAGGGAAGAVAAESVRQAGFNGRLLMISREPHLPIDRIKLSKLLDASVDNLLLYKSDYLEALKVEAHLGKSITKVFPSENKVIVDDGQEFKYDRLLIATGGEPRTLSVPESDLGNIFVLRSLSDNAKLSAALKQFSESKPKVVIIGSSFIGLEAAAMLATKAEQITVVGLENVPLERIMGPVVGNVFMRLHQKNGIKFCMGATTKSFLANDRDPSMVGMVELSDGRLFEADLVVLGVGVKLQSDIIQEGSPLSIGKDGGISVDEHMKAIGSENIYAAGDLARFPFAKTGHDIRSEHWDVAQQQGRIAGHNMAVSLIDSDPKPEVKKYTSIPFFFTMQYGKSMRYAGCTHEGYDDIIITGDAESDSPAFAAYYISRSYL